VYAGAPGVAELPDRAGGSYAAGFGVMSR
jgi:hypothetical protein